jgi:hypothetical protein
MTSTRSLAGVVSPVDYYYSMDESCVPECEVTVVGTNGGESVRYSISTLR